MTFPSRDDLIERIIHILTSENMEGRELGDIAKELADSFYGFMKKEIKHPVTPRLRLGFKHPSLSGIWYIAYLLKDRAWIVNSSTKYGGWVRLNAEWWEYAEESPDNRKDKSKPRPGAPGRNPDYQVGEKYSRSQRASVFEVVATGDKCVLLKGVGLGASRGMTSESNDNMKQYYRKEVNMKEIQW